MKFIVEIKETSLRKVEVEAENLAQAEDLIKDKWDASEIVLNSDDFSDVTFSAKIIKKNTDMNRYISGAIRELCISDYLYTSGTNEEYGNMLLNLVQEGDRTKIAEDIYKHSNDMKRPTVEEIKRKITDIYDKAIQLFDEPELDEPDICD